MNIGIIGLGKMGQGIAHRLIKAGHTVVGFDISSDNARVARSLGVDVVAHSALVVEQARVVWLLLPAGATIDAVLHDMLPNLKSHDIVIDAGNSHYKDSVRRAQLLAKNDLAFIDCGVSGGLQGRDLGYCLMLGGQKTAYDRIEMLLKALAMPEGYAYLGESGAGHYVKMIHNGIEYALMQAYAEGFHLLKHGAYPELDSAQIAHIWNNGSIIRSWLLALMEHVVREYHNVEAISGVVDQTGTGAWIVADAHEHKIPVPCIEKSVYIRTWSQQSQGNYATMLIALLRNTFGGHPLHKKTFIK